MLCFCTSSTPPTWCIRRLQHPRKDCSTCNIRCNHIRISSLNISIPQVHGGFHRDYRTRRRQRAPPFREIRTTPRFRKDQHRNTEMELPTQRNSWSHQRPSSSRHNADHWTRKRQDLRHHDEDPRLDTQSAGLGTS